MQDQDCSVDLALGVGYTDRKACHRIRSSMDNQPQRAPVPASVPLKENA